MAIIGGFCMFVRPLKIKIQSTHLRLSFSAFQASQFEVKEGCQSGRRDTE